ncbi:MAG: hypothetical protein HDKAJFGB_01468 [Anaerolineae bacterium]|nr:hypothetical protein [Anaerolineae bacterium]
MRGGERAEAFQRDAFLLGVGEVAGKLQGGVKSRRRANQILRGFAFSGIGKRKFQLLAFAAALRASDVPNNLGLVGRVGHQIVNAERAAQIEQRVLPIFLLNR